MPRDRRIDTDDEITAVETPRPRTGEGPRIVSTPDVLADLQMRIKSTAPARARDQDDLARVADELIDCGDPGRDHGDEDAPTDSRGASPRNPNQTEDTMEPKPQIPTIGRIVHYHFANGRGTRVTRPAIVLQAWSDKPDALLNLQVFLDGANDAAAGEPGRDLLWATSVNGTPNEHPQATWWSWPPRS